MERLEKIKLAVSSILRMLLIIAAVTSVFLDDWMNLFLSLFTLFLTFLPAIIERKYKVSYTNEFGIILLLFIALSMYLGEIHSFYYIFWWWDIFLHAISSIVIGGIGFLLVHTLNKEKDVELKLSPAFVAVFSLGFSISLGVIWEIFEFSMDSLFGLNMQKSGLIDTMWDLIIYVLGALVVSWFGFIYLKKDRRWLDKIKGRFIE
jgi:hypothetical protein